MISAIIVKRILIGIMFVQHFSFGLIDSNSDPIHPPTKGIQILLLIILIFLWYQADLRTKQLKAKAWITFLVGFISPIGIIAHFFNIYKPKTAIISCMKAILIYIGLTATYLIALRLL
jgi:hypothetical protein